MATQLAPTPISAHPHTFNMATDHQNALASSSDPKFVNLSDQESSNSQIDPLVDHSSKQSKKQLFEDELSPEHLESLYDDLPQDSTALKAIVGTMRLELSKRDQSISHLADELDQVKTTHSVLLQKSAEWKDELELLRIKLPRLEQQIDDEKRAKEAEADRVKDLRLRAEESRRAIMRLQGEQQDARAKAKADHRKSMGAPSFASWVPPSAASSRDENQEADVRKSKRASLIFGLNAFSVTGATRNGHRRSASGSRSASNVSKTGDDKDDSDEGTSPVLGHSNGLRGLRLSGTQMPLSNTLLPPVNPTDDVASSGSRRSSFQSLQGRSPRMQAVDLAAEQFDYVVSSSSLPGNRLSVPGTGNRALGSPALSQGGASSTGINSPILEDEAEFSELQEGTTSSPPFRPINPSRSVSDTVILGDLKAKDAEISKLQRDKIEMRNRLEEAIEARQASEDCLRALREFIASHDAAADAAELSADLSAANGLTNGSGFRTSLGAGLLKGVKLPPLPTDTMAEDLQEEDSLVNKSLASPSKSVSRGWSMKLSTIMRKNTISSNGTSSTGPTPTDELVPSVNSASPQSTPSAGGIIGNLLSRNSVILPGSGGASSGLEKQNSSASQESDTTLVSNENGANLSMAQAGLKGFGWFKKSAATAFNTPSTNEIEVRRPSEERMRSPPFQSLDHHQIAFTRQTELLPPDSLNLNSLAMAAKIGEATSDTEGTDGFVAPKMPAEPQLCYRAQKAAEKTMNIQGDTEFVPAAFD